MARERNALPAVEHVGVVPEGGTPGAGAGPEVGLVDEVGGRAELLGERGDADPPDADLPGVRTRDGLGPDLRVEGVHVGGRGGVVALGPDIGVTGPGGVCGTAHVCWASSEMF